MFGLVDLFSAFGEGLRGLLVTLRTGILDWLQTFPW